ncbi:putative HTH-type transcriptional regulator YfiR [compost metagenome]
MRVVKEHEERRNEILDAAEALFLTKGYDKTTINDILRSIGIAKGTFYYYFTSKEAVLDAMVKRVVDAGVEAARGIADDPTITVHKKFLLIMLAQKPNTAVKQQLIEELHEANNAQMHQKSLSLTVQHLTPVLQEVVEQGIREGLFRTPYPRQSIELLLVAAVTLFDEGLFRWTPEEQAERVQGLIYAMETLLGAKQGSFAYIVQLFDQPELAEAQSLTEESDATNGKNAGKDAIEGRGKDVIKETIDNNIIDNKKSSSKKTNEGKKDKKRKVKNSDKDNDKGNKKNSKKSSDGKKGNSGKKRSDKKQSGSTEAQGIGEQKADEHA